MIELSAVLAIDPGASAGFAVVSEGRVLWCAQSKPAAGERLAEWANLLRIGREMGARRVVIEAPCYAANQARPAKVSAALGERVGELRALAWGVFGEAPADLDWSRWQALPGWAEPMVSGPMLSERRSLRYAVDVLGVPRGWLVTERGAIQYDAATACCIGAAALREGAR